MDSQPCVSSTRREPCVQPGRITWLKPLVLLSIASLLGAQAAGIDAVGGSPDLSDMGIEDLVNIEITSVSKKETRLGNSPAAVAVLTQDDIRRLGMTSIPEALRAVPGMQVARINANMWAVSARGFNDQYSNKLLVLMDGRTLYTPTFGGVHWDAQDMVLEDLDRIEVIRGPGGTLWGANAVNGVINIMSKSSRETQGGLVSTLYGTEDQPAVSARYGGQLTSNLFYRVYVKYFNREGFKDASGQSMEDDWYATRGGFRLDWEPSEANTFTLQGDCYGGENGATVTKTAAIPPTSANLTVEAPTSGGNLLGRWTHRISDDSEIKLQSYYDHYERKNPFGGGALTVGPDFATADGAHEERDTWDVDLQHHFTPFARHDVVWGAAFRYTQDELKSDGSEIIPSPEKSHDALYSVFLQDDMAIVEERLHLTLGSKLEHNEVTGLEYEPGARLAWTPTEQQTLWASFSRAVRTPSRVERDVRVNLASFPLPDGTPAQVPYLNNPNLDSETLFAYELGYRIEPTKRISLDVACFFNDYTFIGTQIGANQFEPTPAPLHVLVNPYLVTGGLRGHTYGVEFLAHWLPMDSWRLTAGYTWLNASDIEGSLGDANPAHQFHLRSTLDLGRGWETHAAIYYVSQITSTSFLGPAHIPGYVRFDLGVTWRVNEHFEFSIWGQNLLDDGHPEFATYKTTHVSEVPRTFYGAITWRFW